MIVTSTAPRWKTAIESALAKYKNQTVIQLATLDTDTPNTSSPSPNTLSTNTSSSSTSSTPFPRVRSHIFRSFLAHPAHPTHPLLLSSTDVRTPKVAQLNETGGRAEVAWWITGEGEGKGEGGKGEGERGVQQQFRVRARVAIVPAPGHALHEVFAGRLRETVALASVGTEAETQRKRETAGLALFPSLDEWEERRQTMFGAMGAHMRASWCRPTPGTPLALSGGPEAAARWPSRVPVPDKERMTQEEYEEARRNWEVGLSNFALVVLDAWEVDLVDLGGELDRRWRFVKVRVEDGGWGWEEEELVP